ncbi:alpha/beta fold hydrolase [Sulfuracidifex metallicus]|uniref:Alpha/beta fold hydrolase n=1 Tax=Sulfuracidifex metallicus DSM 6482 = JCM 9184 TaxID=523847 RepID=A0A6A9QLY5_SULME|nr:alpha/beta hydrolase [Sulfuracidifex metallicus]MUN29320.1 alpha/beta fold hydrolase [Sulfuracidifex metallicus DSM 6482 = JCM 9184]WOE50167.1 alpha/beta hydrolase [Sulfuracidifex metallicus DSM 6482 = JCM 9184]
MLSLEDKYVEVNGVKIHYLEKGEGKPFLLFHGARFNAYTYKETGTIDAIAEVGYKAISVDFPGYGKSSSGNFGSLSDFINSFVDTMKLDKPILLGASMGGEAVLGFAVTHPEKVRGLVLVGAVGVPSYEKYLPKLDGKPVLLIWGSQDSVSPRSNAELIQRYIKTSKFYNVGKQHACYLDDANGFNVKIKEFLKGL